MYIIHYRKMTASVFEDPQTTELHGFSWIFSITYYHHVPFFNCLATLFINHIHPVISRFSLVFFGSTHSINRFLNASEEQRIFFSARRGRSRGARPGNAWRAQVGRWRCGSDGSHWNVSGWWFQPTPLKNMSLSVGMMKFPIYGKA